MLHRNQTAPTICTTSISGQNINLDAFKGKKVLIKFHRFSGCPVAQNQLHEIITHQKELNAAGIETILLLHSTKDKIVPVYKEVHGLHIIADRQKRFYTLYNSRFSWKAFFSPASWIITFKSFLKGYFPLLRRFQGGFIAVPSDFLVDEQGIVINLHYGKHFGDSWSSADVLAMA